VCAPHELHVDFVFGPSNPGHDPPPCDAPASDGPTLGPQTSPRGTHALVWSPDAVLSVVHALSLEHSLPFGQSGAQYVSDENCAQTEPAAQSLSVTHALHAAGLPPLDASAESVELPWLPSMLELVVPPHAARNNAIAEKCQHLNVIKRLPRSTVSCGNVRARAR
jgi:hypothetical protein